MQLCLSQMFRSSLGWRFNKDVYVSVTLSATAEITAPETKITDSSHKRTKDGLLNTISFIQQ